MKRDGAFKKERNTHMKVLSLIKKSIRGFLFHNLYFTWELSDNHCLLDYTVSFSAYQLSNAQSETKLFSYIY